MGGRLSAPVCHLGCHSKNPLLVSAGGLVWLGLSVGFEKSFGSFVGGGGVFVLASPGAQGIPGLVRAPPCRPSTSA